MAKLFTQLLEVASYAVFPAILKTCYYNKLVNMAKEYSPQCYCNIDVSPEYWS